MTTILLPRTGDAPAIARESTATSGAARRSCVGATLRRKGRCSVFLALAEACRLAEELDGHAPYTVFAPDDDAFSALGAGAIELLRGPDNELAHEVLEHHVVRGALLRGALGGATRVNSLQGEPLTLRRHGLGLRVDDAHVQVADLRAGVSVVHVVSRVLSPRWSMPATATRAARWRRFELDRLRDERRSGLGGARSSCEVQGRRCS